MLDKDSMNRKASQIYIFLFSIVFYFVSDIHLVDKNNTNIRKNIKIPQLNFDAENLSELVDLRKLFSEPE